MIKIARRKTRVVKIGRVAIGGGNPVAIQSMVKCKTSRVAEVLRQIKELDSAGCEIVRVAVKDSDDARAIKKIKEGSALPLVADIHFSWRLGLQAIEAGADKIRLNPGNIYKREEVLPIVEAARKKRIPIRVGLNSGSLPRVSSGSKEIPDRMVEAAMEYIGRLEGAGFFDIVVSVKASNIPDTLAAYRKIAARCDYPLHLGVTATGTPYAGAIKSAIAIGALLLDGIGDTIRISLTEKPQEEVKAAKCILEAVGMRGFGPEIISCPTCGRCEVDLVKIVSELEKRLSAIDYPCPSGRRGLTTRQPQVAVMGCVVNGPGEAAQADLGIAFGKGSGLLFKKGKPVRKIPSADACKTLLKELTGICSGRKH